MRDISEKQFIAACKRRGWTISQTMFGYVRSAEGLSVSRLNCDGTRRQQLAYLVRQFQRLEKLCHRKEPTDVR